MLVDWKWRWKKMLVVWRALIRQMLKADWRGYAMEAGWWKTMKADWRGYEMEAGWWKMLKADWKNAGWNDYGWDAGTKMIDVAVW